MLEYILGYLPVLVLWITGTLIFKALLALGQTIVERKDCESSFMAAWFRNTVYTNRPLPTRAIVATA